VVPSCLWMLSIGKVRRGGVNLLLASVLGVCPHRDFFIRNLHDALSGHTSNSVEEAIAFSEQSNTKCIGITIETRPDYCLKPHLNSMLQVLGGRSVCWAVDARFISVCVLFLCSTGVRESKLVCKASTKMWLVTQTGTVR
jgi:hypothetical protein